MYRKKAGHIARLYDYLYFEITVSCCLEALESNQQLRLILGHCVDGGPWFEKGLIL